MLYLHVVREERCIGWGSHLRAVRGDHLRLWVRRVAGVEAIDVSAQHEQVCLQFYSQQCRETIVVPEATCTIGCLQHTNSHFTNFLLGSRAPPACNGCERGRGGELLLIRLLALRQSGYDQCLLFTTASRHYNCYSKPSLSLPLLKYYISRTHTQVCLQSSRALLNHH